MVTGTITATAAATIASVSGSVPNGVPSWPATLPQVWLQDGFSFEFPDGLLRDNETVEDFPLQTRVQSLAAPATLQGRIPLSPDQLEDLVVFFRGELKLGARSFMYKDPITEDTTRLRFLEPPKITAQGRDFLAECNLEVMRS